MIGFDPYVFEFLNLIMSMLAAAGAVVFVRYLVIEYKKGFFRFPQLFGIRHKTAVACVFAFGGESGLRGYVWFSRFLRNTGIDLPILNEWYVLTIPLLFAAAQCMGLMCIVKVFEPDEWRYYYTITSLCIVSALSIRFFALIWGP